ncbi:hypothetical protein B0H14DRAFT_3781514 [Mycena olivaceomarginata]|nr:hypothetical protein B0H14DRAFT_3781514 [Mycena olivaceomarginata]
MGPPPNFRPSIDYHISERLPAGGPAICSSSRETYTTNSASPDPISFEAPALRPQTFAVNANGPREYAAVNWVAHHYPRSGSGSPLELHPEDHPMLKTRVRLFIYEGAKTYHARAAIDPAAFISGPTSPVHEKHRLAHGDGPLPRLLTDRVAGEVLADAGSPSEALHMRGVWALPLLYVVFALTLYINGVGDAGALNLLSSFACAGITIAHRTILCTRVTAPKEFMCQLLLIYTCIAPVVLYVLTMLFAPLPPVLQCLTPGFLLTWSCAPIGINVLVPLTIFAACQWMARQIEKKSLSAAGLV